MLINSTSQIANKVVSGQPKTNENNNSDCLFAKLRGYLIWGKFLGIVPLQGLFKTNDSLEHLNFRYFSAEAIPCILISMLLLVFSITGFIGLMDKGNDIFATADLPILYLGGFFFIIYFLQGASQNIIQLLRNWRSKNLHFKKEDIHLGRDVFLISGIIFSTLIVVDFAFMLSMYNRCNKSDQEKAFLKSYYDFEFKIWANALPYNPVLVVFMIVADQIGWFAWIYGDTFLILITRALHFKFNFLCEIGKSHSDAAKQNLKGADSRFWILLSKDVDTLYKLVDRFATILSPLIFTIYAMNIFQMSLAIYALLTGATGDDPLYSTSLFLHNVGRFFFLHLMAARVNDCSSRIEEVFWDCPNEYYSLDVQRTVQRLASRQIGFHGFKCFYITKPLFLTLLSTLFTIQIFFLQKVASS